MKLIKMPFFPLLSSGNPHYDEVFVWFWSRLVVEDRGLVGAEMFLSDEIKECVDPIFVHTVNRCQTQHELQTLTAETLLPVLSASLSLILLPDPPAVLPDILCLFGQPRVLSGLPRTLCWPTLIITDCTRSGQSKLHKRQPCSHPAPAATPWLN